MKTTELKKYIENGALDTRLRALYGEAAADAQRARYLKAVASFAALYGERDGVRLFSVPGRSELSGNHTDHNHGCVIAASINLDIIAVAAPTIDGAVHIYSEGYGENTVVLAEYSAPRAALFGKSEALIAGMCTGMAKAGYQTGGFVAYTTSSVLKGSGLSSSAAFEVMVGNIENHLYNGGAVDNIEIAKIAQYAENEFFGKPCGLMDQSACAVGGIIAIDFADNTAPVIEKIDFDITAAGYHLCIVNTGGNHADLTPDYTAIPAEMKAVAAALGKQVLREVDETALITAIPALRKQVGDRAILRALHFFGENRRVAEQKQALRAGNLDTFFQMVVASGRSSFCYLQNVYTTENVAEQGLSLALILAERALADKSAAWRVHGGGFAGTVQAFVPAAEAERFRTMMDAVFGTNACMVLRVRAEGATTLL